MNLGDLDNEISSIDWADKKELAHVVYHASNFYIESAKMEIRQATQCDVNADKPLTNTSNKAIKNEIDRLTKKYKHQRSHTDEMLELALEKVAALGGYKRLLIEYYKKHGKPNKAYQDIINNLEIIYEKSVETTISRVKQLKELSAQIKELKNLLMLKDLDSDNQIY